MDYKKTIETKIYGEPDEKNHVKEIGMRTVGEVFEELKDKLRKEALMPDEYFLLSPYLKENDKMPNFIEAVCYPNFGGSEGIYFDIALRCKNAVGQGNFINFATGKTLGETTADYYRMSLIAGECSMLLNGNGCNIKNNTNTILILNDEEVDELKSGLRLQAVVNEGYSNSNETVNKLINNLQNNTEKEQEIENDEEEL